MEEKSGKVETVEMDEMNTAKSDLSQVDVAAAPPAPAKEPMAKQVLKQVFGLALAGVFLYFSFKDADWNKLWHYTQQLNPMYLGFLAISGLAGHVIRAWRWVILLQPLSDRKISLWNSFCAVMYGYAVNVVLPRGGEIARLLAMSKSESIPWVGVLPTMFIDRLLDIAMLVLLLGITITVFPMPMDLPWLLPAGQAMCVATFVGLGALPFAGRIGRAILSMGPIQKLIPAAIAGKLDQLLVQFDQGTKSLTNPLMVGAIAVMSVAIWTCYFINLYCVILAFNLQNVIDLPKALVTFTIGSVGVLVPTPGSVGSYHYLTSQCLQRLGNVNPDQSLAFATVLHFMSFIVLTCIPAAICFAVQSGKKAK